MLRGARTGVFVLIVLAVSAASIAALSAENVYYGNRNSYKKPAEINAKKVFAAIPAYKEIIEKSIAEDSALYIAKLAEANKVFKKAVTSYAEDNKYDLVCEEGSVKNAPNGTDDLVKLAAEVEVKDDNKESKKDSS